MLKNSEFYGGMKNKLLNHVLPLRPRGFTESIKVNSTLISGVALLNLECKPRPAVVTTSSRPVFDYYPYFVHLHRCSGSKGKTSPQLVRCVADRVEKFRIEAKLSTSFKKVEVEVVNHTSCKNECVMKRNECRPPARFDPQSCKCICDLGVLGPYGKICRDTRKM